MSDPGSERDDFELEPLDRVLDGLCRECGPDPYRLVPGEGDAPDRWTARCPLHPDAGFTLLLVPRPGGEVAPACSVGCAPVVIREVLDPDPEREEAAWVALRLILWKENWSKRERWPRRRVA